LNAHLLRLKRHWSARLDGKKIAIYSRVENVTRQAKLALEVVAPNVEVERPESRPGCRGIVDLPTGRAMIYSGNPT